MFPLPSVYESNRKLGERGKSYIIRINRARIVCSIRDSDSEYAGSIKFV